MAEKGSLDFDCPMFVDFGASQQDLSGDATCFFQNRISPARTPEKMRIPFNQYHLAASTNNFWNKTDSFKINQQKFQFSKRLSRSDGAIYTLTAKKSEISRKRSLSESEIKPKKKTCPVTPMCLKRPKSKKMKSTEEIELEKIAELQKQTRLRLRYNELSMKRLNLKPKPSTLPVHKASSNEDPHQIRANKFIALGSIAERVGACPKKKLLKAQSDKDLDDVFTPATKPKDLPSTSHASRQPLLLVNRMTADKSEKKLFKNPPKPMTAKRMVPHCGVFFNRCVDIATLRTLNPAWNSNVKLGNFKKMTEKEVEPEKRPILTQTPSPKKSLDEVPSPVAVGRFNKENVFSVNQARAVVEEAKRTLKKDVFKKKP